jgi:hypothetical protein
VAEAGPPADLGEPVRHVIRVQRRPQGARKDQVVFPPGRSDCDPFPSQTSAVAPQQFNQFRVRKRVRRGGLS